MNLYFISHNGISISRNHSSACILWGIFICIAVFSVSINLWSPHNNIADSQNLRLVQIPDEPLLIFFTYYLIFSMVLYLTHELFRSVRSLPGLQIFPVGLKKFCVFSSCWIDMRSNLLTVLFKFSIELLDFIYCVYQLLKELYKCSTLVVDFSVSPCGPVSFCFMYFDAML